MAFTKEIKGKTVLFAKSAKFIQTINKLYTIPVEKEENGEKMTLNVAGGDSAIGAFLGLFGKDVEVERETLEYYLSIVAYSLQFKLTQAEFMEWISNLDNADLVEFSKKVKEELDAKKLIKL